MFGYDLIGAAIYGMLGGLGGLGAVPFTRCDRCVSPAYCSQRGRCGTLDAEEQLHRNEQLRAYWQSVDPNTIDLGPDAVRYVPEPLLLVAPVEWSLGRVECDSDGGECD
ncbi:MAG: hypothetical protein EPN70_03430 [Paraburkholderia sp.]|uniref:hypothetical protein n=1 Tax=Paraburkholderia sp. TaxID=1926495 RepID=UPI00122A8419|nr:hypothetical protein [Paraburkholderia sp.]TAM07236.1 MAG: hypothetical protein EPN70_03430 [Paraburkholderia sp.]TAM32625.1 MAG: hypothetical protein EPN59_01630 [Paraburkholderia sp.]